MALDERRIDYAAIRRSRSSLKKISKKYCVSYKLGSYRAAHFKCKTPEKPRKGFKTTIDVTNSKQCAEAPGFIH